MISFLWLGSRPALQCRGCRHRFSGTSPEQREIYRLQHKWGGSLPFRPYPWFHHKALTTICKMIGSCMNLPTHRSCQDLCPWTPPLHYKTKRRTASAPADSPWQQPTQIMEGGELLESSTSRSQMYDRLIIFLAAYVFCVCLFQQ